MSSAPRATKCRKASRFLATQSRFWQRQAASPSMRIKSELQIGQIFGKIYFSEFSGLKFIKTSTTSGITSPAF